MNDTSVSGLVVGCALAAGVLEVAPAHTATPMALTHATCVYVYVYVYMLGVPVPAHMLVQEHPDPNPSPNLGPSP